jgi:hypothetical protein
MIDRELEVFERVRKELCPSLIKKDFAVGIQHPMFGHCHHASLSMYRLLGGKEKGYKLQRAVDDDGFVHYWLLSPLGEIIDPTVEQYTELNRPLPYSNIINGKASYLTTKSTKIIVLAVTKILAQRSCAIKQVVNPELRKKVINRAEINNTSVAFELGRFAKASGLNINSQPYGPDPQCDSSVEWIHGYRTAREKHTPATEE